MKITLPAQTVGRTIGACSLRRVRHILTRVLLRDHAKDSTLAGPWGRT